eukprot:s405_g23.t1
MLVQSKMDRTQHWQVSLGQNLLYLNSAARLPEIVHLQIMNIQKKPGNGLRQFRSGDPMDEKESNRTWDCLRHAIHQIHQHNASSLSFEELYRNAYNLVLHKYGELLYNGVQGVVADHLKVVAQSCIDCPSDRLLEELKKQWDDHKTTMVMIRDILMYMDRNFVTQYKKVPVYEMGLMIFREKVSGHARVKSQLLTLMLDNINAERRGEQVDRILLKHTVNMLVELGVQGKNVYRECFEDQFLDHTRKFYQDESKQYISQNPCSDYLKKAEKRIREEKARVENYLHESTMEKIQELCDEEWIQVHYKTLIHMENSGCAWMFQCDKIEDLERMYLLFCRVPVTLKEVQKVVGLTNSIPSSHCSSTLQPFAALQPHHPGITMAFTRSLHRRRLGALLLCLALCCRRWLRAQVLGPRPAATPLAPLEVARIHAAVRSRALEAVAEGKLPAGRELELISALDLETVPWSCLVDSLMMLHLVFPHQISRKVRGNLGKTVSPDVDEMPLKSKSESSLNPETYREGVWKRSLAARHFCLLDFALYGSKPAQLEANYLLASRNLDFWGLPGADRGIDSLALNLSTAVQAKDYQDYVPLERLATFHYLVRSEGSPLKDRVQQMVVATNETTRLPQDWEWSGAKHRRYTQDEIERWRELARNESAKDVTTEIGKKDRGKHFGQL